jgi:uncharacterized protein YggU (UPF0235/DUF167 family)
MYIKVKVTAGAKKESLKQTGPNRFAISVKAPAERGLANQAILILLAAHLKLPRSHLRLISGHHTPAN